MTTATLHTEEQLQAKYARYAAKHPKPLSFEGWLYFYTEGCKAAAAGDMNKMTTKERSEAGKKGAAKRWGKRP